MALFSFYLQSICILFGGEDAFHEIFATLCAQN